MTIRKLWLGTLVLFTLLFAYTAIYYGRLTAPIHAIAIEKQASLSFVPRYRLHCDYANEQCDIKLGGQVVDIRYWFEPQNSPFGHCLATVAGNEIGCSLERVYYPWRSYVVLENIDAGLPQWRLQLESFFAQLGLGNDTYWVVTMAIVATIIGVLSAIEYARLTPQLTGLIGLSVSLVLGLGITYILGFVALFILMISGVILD